MRRTLLAVLLLVVAAIAVAQQQQPYIETFEVRLHDLDVVVTDRQGKPVSGLTKQISHLTGKLFHYRTDLVVAAGRTRIAVGVLDEASKLSGFSTIEVQAR